MPVEGAPERAAAPPAAGAAAGAADGLLRAVARGDAAAFERLYPLLAAPVHGLALRVLRDPGLAQDVTQEVLVDVWRLAPRYDPARGSALTWALTITHRRAVDRVRREQAHVARTARVAAGTRERDEDVVVAAVESTWDAALVQRAMAALTPLQREAIELAYFGGHTHQEVSAMLAVPLGTAKTRIRDGLIRLRDALGVSEP